MLYKYHFWWELLVYVVKKVKFENMLIFSCDDGISGGIDGVIGGSDGGGGSYGGGGNSSGGSVGGGEGGGG